MKSLQNHFDEFDGAQKGARWVELVLEGPGLVVLVEKGRRQDHHSTAPLVFVLNSRRGLVLEERTT